MALLGSVSVLASCATARRARTLLGSVHAVSDPQLSRELELLAARPYSESGIPVLLFGENRDSADPLTPTDNRDSQAAAPEPEDLRKAFEQLSLAFRRIRPDPVSDDVALLIEWLAERDFGTALASKGGRP